MSFTLFVILPTKDVCSLRHLASGTPIKAVRKTLELTAGLPAQTYRLTCSEGQILHEDHVLRMDVNVWDGYVIRAVFLDSWQELYDHIVANDVEHVIKYGAVHMRDDVVWKDVEEKEKAREVMRERGVVALFVASFLGMQEMCRALLSVGVNPNGKSLFGKTPLFAAMARDHDLVMELLLSDNASLVSRDADGVTAVDVGRRAAAKQCMRKVRHLHLQSKAESSTASEVVKRRGGRVIRIPTSHVQKDAAALGLKSGTSHDDSAERSAFWFSGEEIHPGKGEQGERKPPRSQHPKQGSRAPPPRALFRQQDKDGDFCYTWDNNNNNNNNHHLSHTAARTPSATTTTTTATQIRLSLASTSEGQIHSSRRWSQGTRGGGAGTSWSDNKSVSSSTARMLPFRPSVHQLSIKGPGSVLTTSSTTSIPTLSSVTLCSLQPEERNVKSRRPSALVRFLAQSPHSQTSNHHRSQRPHVPAREPPGRPPTRADTNQLSAESQDQPHGGSESVLGSQEALSVGSAPELTAGDTAKAAGGTADADHGDSDDDGGRVVTSHATGSRFSGRHRTRMLVSRQKQQESWKTMKRRIKLAEEQKRNSTLRPHHHPKPATETKESFEHWLERKRRENYSTDSEDTSEDDEDMISRTAENCQILNDWLKDVEQRGPSRPQTSSPVSLHRQKNRPAKNVTDAGRSEGVEAVDSAADGGQREAESSSYLAAYEQWQHRKKRSASGPQGTLQGMEETKRQLEEKRKSLLAMALTFQDWEQHAEQRKKLMQAILRADMDKLSAIEQYLSNAHTAPRQISFNEWRDKVDKREAEIRHQRQRMRKEAEFRQRNGVVGDEFMRNTATHDEWTQQKREHATKERNRARRSVDASIKDGDSVTLSEDEKENAVEEWLKQKRKTEVAQLNEHLCQERRLLLSLRQKKSPTVTQC
ncbi:hypothetical protein ACOMHN_019584 [Nucella lapillus]